MGRFGRNILFNQAGFVVSALAAFIMAPITVAHLGDEFYGIWSLLMSFAGHYGLLTLGLQSALSRYLTYSIAQGDTRAMNSYFNTALAVLLVSGAAALGLGTGLAYALDTLFVIPGHGLEEARMACILIALTAGTTFAFAPFQGMLVGGRRYGLVNALAVGATLVRSIGVYLLLIHGYGLVQLALANLGVTLGMGLIQVILVHFIYGDLHFSPGAVTRSGFRDLMQFGMKTFVVNISTLLIYQCDLFVIGAFLPPERVTVYSLGLTLVTYFIQLITASVSVMTTHLVAVYAREKLAGIRNLFLPLSAFLHMAGGLVVAGCLVFGPLFYSLWIGTGYGESAWIMGVLMVPQFFFTGTRICTSLFIATDTIGPMAKFSLAEGLANVILSLALVKPLGLMGVALGTLVPSLVNSLIILPGLALGQLKLSWPSYWIRSLLPGLWVAGAAALGGHVFLTLVPVQGWAGFGLGVVFTSLVAGLAIWGVLKIYGIPVKAMVNQLT